MTFNIETFIEVLRGAFIKELESTGSYTKVGMTAAFDKACCVALARFLRPEERT